MKKPIATRYCEVCGSPLSIINPNGAKISAGVYAKRRFCSVSCVNKWRTTVKKTENPTKDDRLYYVWQGMKDRCNNPNNIKYANYGYRGISVCDEWVSDYQAFKEWALANGYDYSKSRKEQSIDRIDNNKGYSPDNCRFVSHSTNCKNKSNNVLITYNGMTLCATDWAEITGLTARTICERAQKTSDPEIILDTRKMAHRSNTGIKGISWQEKEKRFLVYADGHMFLGVRRKLEDAIKLRNGIE